MNNSGNTFVNQISKRDYILAFAKQEISLGDHLVDTMQAIKGLGHWNDNCGVYLYVDEIALDKIEPFDVFINYDDWDIFILVRFKYEKK